MTPMATSMLANPTATKTEPSMTVMTILMAMESLMPATSIRLRVWIVIATASLIAVILRVVLLIVISMDSSTLVRSLLMELSIAI